MKNKFTYIIIFFLACFKMFAQPANNACASAINLGSVSTTTTTTGTNAAATADVAGADAYVPVANIWYNFTVPAGGGSYSVSVKIGTMTKPNFTVGQFATNCSTVGVSILGNTTSNTTTSGTTISATVNCLAAGQYYIIVDNKAGAVSGTFSLTVTQTSAGGAPSNDLCTGAISLGTVSTTTTITGTNSCAGVSGTDPSPGCAFGVSNSVWYSFTTPATAGSNVITLTHGTITYASMGLYTGTCAGGFSEVSCSDDGFTSTFDPSISGCLLPSTTYYLFVWDDAGIAGTYTLTNTFTSGATTNDDCTGAINLGTAFTNTTVSSSNVCATADNDVACTIATQNVWYKFTTGAGTGYTGTFTVTAGSLTYPAVAVLSGTCGTTLASIGCSDPDNTATTPATLTVTCLSPNTTYYVEVDQNWLDGTQGTFTLTANLTASGGPPSNDLCSGAISLGTVNTTTTTTGSNVCAWPDVYDPSCFFYNQNVWYSFVVPAGGASYNISVTGGTLTYPNVAVVQFATVCSATGLTEVSCDFGSSSSVTTLANCLAAGTYYIMVDDDDFSGTPGTFSLTVTQTSTGGPPSNDNCSGATNLGTVSTSTTIAGTNICASADVGSPSCFTSNANVWYSFTVPAGGGTYLFNLTSGTITVPRMAIWQFATACTSSGATYPTCNKNSTNAPNISSSACLAAGTYYIMIDNSASALTGSFTLTVTQTSTGSPANNACAGAINLGSITTTTTVAGDNTCATSDVGNPSCFTSNQNVWYSFTVPAGGGIYLFSLIGGSMQRPTLAVWSYTTACTAAGATYPVCNKNSSNKDTVTGSACMAAGTYYIMVDNKTTGVAGTFSLTVTQTSSGSSPTNDNCAGATTVVVGTCVNGDVTCASQSQVGCTGTANDDIWYKFVATGTTVDINVSASASFDPVVEVLSGACAATVTGSLLCDDVDYTTGGLNECKSLAGLTVGNTYFIRVYDAGAGVPATTTFTMCLTSLSTYTCNLNYTYSTIPVNIESGVSTTIPGLIDDYLSNVVQIGFPFCFDGFQYTQLYVSSNASLVFDAVEACIPNVDQPRVPAGNSVYSGWSIAGPAPTTTDYTPQNAILGPWHDIDPARGGTITYATLGVSPNRRFVVYFNAVKQYYSSSPCQNTSYDYTAQLKIYETSNNIEIHIQQQKNCNPWNNGQGILGLHNAYGTLAVVPTGYNATASSPYNQFAITNTAWRFVTSCAGCTIILPLEIIDFTAKQKDDLSNEISWVTASEDVNSWFHVEKSVDGKTFETATIIKAANPNGGTYDYTDNLSNKNQMMYYRIATQDANGKFSYSGIRLVQRDNIYNVSVLNAYPNPFSNEINVDIESVGNNNIKIEIFDILGKKVYSNDILLADGTNSFVLDDINSTSGLLLLKVTDNSGNIMFTKKIMKE